MEAYHRATWSKPYCSRLHRTVVHIAEGKTPMRPPGLHRFFAAIGVALVVITAGRPVSAQNENETVGFKPSHVYESGAFGENIDMLGGNLNLSIPIGQRYQVNDRLGYQLTLSYNSKVWDWGDWKSTSVNMDEWVKLRGRGPLGVGFSLHLGRIVQDAHWRLKSSDELVHLPEIRPRIKR